MSQPYSIGRLTRTRTDGSTYWSFCIVYRDPEGQRKRYSLNTTDRVAADAQARRVYQTLVANKTLETIGDIVDAYLGPKDRPDPVPDDKRKREQWKAAKPYWGNIRLSQVDAQLSADYLTWRDKAINTMRGELSLVRAAINWVVADKQIDKAAVPTDAQGQSLIKLPAMPETSVGHLTKEEFRRFLDGCGAPHVRLFAMLGVTTGGRKSALLQARWEQVDFGRKLMDLNPSGRKQNSKFRATVPLNDMILPALHEAKQSAMTGYVIEHHGKPCADIKKGFAAAAKRSGVSCHPHMLRHSAAVWMAEDRVPMAEIASYLGHRDINVTIRIYARYHPDYLREAARSLTW